MSEETLSELASITTFEHDYIGSYREINLICFDALRYSIEKMYFVFYSLVNYIIILITNIMYHP
ncbi:hypothetical protein X777_11247 [Ooceraea biroi]|uniref:Uncharacterized protein n=1 Tax=Ooceraea biroi TaxID=2015173 RepID=A0A026W579_OOCBI|nr:hypothetical protein X777_11247 [Ooceraea biroi]